MVLATLGGVDVRGFVAPLKQNKHLMIYIYTEIHKEYTFTNDTKEMSSTIYTSINCMKNITCFLPGADRRAQHELAWFGLNMTSTLQ